MDQLSLEHIKPYKARCSPSSWRAFWAAWWGSGFLRRSFFRGSWATASRGQARISADDPAFADRCHERSAARAQVRQCQATTL